MLFPDIAHLAGLPDEVVTRAEQISKEFSADFKQKQMVKRRSDLSVLAQAGEYWCSACVLELESDSGPVA